MNPEPVVEYQRPGRRSAPPTPSAGHDHDGTARLRLTRLTYVSTTIDSLGASLLSFRPSAPLVYNAGQFGLWICGAAARPFTIASTPGDEYVQLGTRLHRGSRIKRALGALRPGDRIRLLGAMGRVAPPEDGHPVVFAAQGIGITAARSLLREPATWRRILTDAHYVVTGSSGFVKSTGEALQAVGIPRDRLHTDSYLGLPDHSRP
jgi:ferredoxin-NADP reductase